MSSINVVFDIPIEIEEGLKIGRYIRKGGVIVQGNGKPEVVKWLNEGQVIARNGKKLDTLSKFSNIAQSSMNILSVVILNEKLNQIQKSIESIDKKLEIGFRAELLTANQLLLSAEHIKDKDLQNRQLSQAREHYYKTISIYSQHVQRGLDKAEEYFEEFINKWELNVLQNVKPNRDIGTMNPIFVKLALLNPIEIPAEMIKQLKRWFDCKSVDKMYIELKIVLEYIKVTMLGYLGAAKTYYLQGEVEAAQMEIRRLERFITSIEEKMENKTSEEFVTTLTEKLKRSNIDFALFSVSDLQLSDSSERLKLYIENELISLKVDNFMIVNYIDEMEAIPYFCEPNSELK